jgi:RHS repeat-associated protein
MQYFDRETNLSYNYFRDYDSATGRYIQSDPIGVIGGINTYAYVRAHPLWAIDV